MDNVVWPVQRILTNSPANPQLKQYTKYKLDLFFFVEIITMQHTDAQKNHTHACKMKHLR